MKTILKLSGLHCGHCEMRVQKALEAFPGVKAKVSAKKQEAIIQSSAPLDNERIKQAVADAGYLVEDITIN